MSALKNLSGPSTDQQSLNRRQSVIPEAKPNPPIMLPSKNYQKKRAYLRGM
jgi:hypothetical protein